MSKVPNQSDPARVSTEEERAENARRHDDPRRALHPEPAGGERGQLERKAASVPTEAERERVEQWARDTAEAMVDAGMAVVQLEERVEKLENVVDELLELVEQLVAGMSTEVRTRRLVVVDDRGVERIVAEVDMRDTPDASVQVRAASDPDTWAGIFAGNIMEGGHPVAQIDLSVDGAIHTQLVAAPVAGWWRPERPAHVRRTDVRTEFMLAGETVLEGYSDTGANPRKADG